MANKDISRRDFIKAAGMTAAGVFTGALSSADLFAQGSPAGGRVIGANDRINVAFVGVGGRGSSLLKTTRSLIDAKNLSIVAVCDVAEPRTARWQGELSLPASAAYKDYRKLLENKDIDVVVIATPDHWHGKATLDALQAGKHVYCEKPMTRHLDEAFKVMDVAKKTGKLVQVGSQGCSEAKWYKAGEMVKAGNIGQVLWAQGSYCRNNPKGEWNYDIKPDITAQNTDWKLWLGNAPAREWSPERFFRWRKYWDYGTGIIGDLWPHRLYPLMIAMNINEYPKRVACIGANLCNTDEGNGDMRDVADNTLMVVEFPSGAQIILAGSTVNEQGLEDIVRGNKATLYIGGDKIQFKPERPYTDELEQADVTIEGAQDDSKGVHMANLMDCIRSGGKPNCDVELGVRVQTIVSLAERSYRESKMMLFDSKTLKVI